MRPENLHNRDQRLNILLSFCETRPERNQTLENYFDEKQVKKFFVFLSVVSLHNNGDV